MRGDFDNLSVIDGFTSVQALRHAKQHPSGPRFRPSRTTLPAVEKKDKTEKKVTTKPATRISHTVIPDKFEIVCYECDYEFTLPGHVHDTICPKCHMPLKMVNYTIDSASNEKIKTIGTIDLKPEALLKGGADLTAMDVIIAGNAEEGRIHARRRLVLCSGAKFDITRIKTKDLFIKSGGKFTITRKIACRNLEVEGNLRARIFADGIVTIRSGGFLKGELHSPHLTVEEGGGLKAKLVVGIRR